MIDVNCSNREARLRRLTDSGTSFQIIKWIVIPFLDQDAARAEGLALQGGCNGGCCNDGGGGCAVMCNMRSRARVMYHKHATGVIPDTCTLCKNDARPAGGWWFPAASHGRKLISSIFEIPTREMGASRGQRRNTIYVPPPPGKPIVIFHYRAFRLVIYLSADIGVFSFPWVDDALSWTYLLVSFWTGDRWSTNLRATRVPQSRSLIKDNEIQVRNKKYILFPKK